MPPCIDCPIVQAVEAMDRVKTGEESVWRVGKEFNSAGTSRQAWKQIVAYASGDYKMATCEQPELKGWRYVLWKELRCEGIVPTQSQETNNIGE